LYNLASVKDSSCELIKFVHRNQFAF